MSMETPAFTSVPENSQRKEESEEIKDVDSDIRKRGGGNPGILKVLKMIQVNLGEDVYRKLVPNLGEKYEIWEKFQECNEDLGELFLKYIGEDNDLESDK